MKAVQVVAFGRPAEAVRLNEVPDVGSPGPNEVVVAVEAAPINNSDFMIIAGRYGYLPTPPATLGCWPVSPRAAFVSCRHRAG